MKHVLGLKRIFLLLVLLLSTSLASSQTEPDFWQQTNGPFGGRVNSFAINSNGDIFAGTSAYSGIFRSTDNGNNWTQINTGLTTTFVLALAFNSTGDIFAGTAGGVFRSTDNGDNWSQINTGLTRVVFALAMNSNGDIFAGTDADGVYHSSDNGENWTQTGLTNGRVRALAINSSDDIFAGTFGGMFRSTDNGDNWSQVKTGFPPYRSVGVGALAINSNGDIFAGTFQRGTSISGGVFRSTDNGDNWSQINAGLENTTVSRTTVRALAINSNGDIFAGTDAGNEGGGVFRSVGSTTAVEEIPSSIPSSFAVEQNYPNPFNPSTVISYQLSKSSDIELTIYNQLGQEVRTLVNERNPAGAYQIEWDGRDHAGRQVASGVYLYRLKAGSFVETRKMVLIR